MNIALWVLQVVLALAFLTSGGMKLMSTKEKLTADPRMGWANDFEGSHIKLIGLSEVLGAVGLVAPWALRIAPVLTPIAAAGLCVLMIGAARTHQRRKEPTIVPMVLALLSALVAIGRFQGL
jgi:uncharacterized membrane protein YphA (DoxX/SURF4 family)